MERDAHSLALPTAAVEPAHADVDARTLEFLETPDSRPEDRQFDTSHLNQNIKSRTARGGAVTLSAQGVKFLLKLGATAVLARLLTPADYGLIAMVTVLTGFVEMFTDAGLSMATIQQEKITHAQVSTLFWINLALSALVMILVAASAPLIAWFYDEPRLIAVTLALSVNLLLVGLGVQHRAVLRRRMQFGRLAFIDVVSLTAGTVCAIFMAVYGLAYWSLVGLTATTAFTAAVLAFALTGWVPGWPVRGSGVRPMLAVGSNLTGASMIGYFGRSGDSLIVGQVFGAQSLGLYNRSLNLMLAPWNQLLGPLHGVIEPALCRVRLDPRRFKEVYQQYVSLGAAVSVPATLLIAFNARTVVTVFLGADWLDAVPIFVALSAATIMAGLRPAVGWLFTPLGRAHLHLSWSLLSTPVVFGAYLVGACFGPIEVAIGFGIAEIVLFIVGIEYSVRGTFLCRKDVWICILPAAIGSAVGSGTFFYASRYGEAVASVFFVVVAVVLIAVVQRGLHIPAIWDHLTQNSAFDREANHDIE